MIFKVYQIEKIQLLIDNLWFWGKAQQSLQQQVFCSSTSQTTFAHLTKDLFKIWQEWILGKVSSKSWGKWNELKKQNGVT